MMPTVTKRTTCKNALQQNAIKVCKTLKECFQYLTILFSVILLKFIDRLENSLEEWEFINKSFIQNLIVILCVLAKQQVM